MTEPLTCEDVGCRCAEQDFGTWYADRFVVTFNAVLHGEVRRASSRWSWRVYSTEVNLEGYEDSLNAAQQRVVAVGRALTEPYND